MGITLAAQTAAAGSLVDSSNSLVLSSTKVFRTLYICMIFFHLVRKK